MTTLNIYLNFDGNCEAAFNFYETCFGTEIAMLSRFNEMPPQEGMPPLPEDHLNRIMHVTLPISQEAVLMGSDTGGGWTPDFKQGNNFFPPQSLNYSIYPVWLAPVLIPVLSKYTDLG